MSNAAASIVDDSPIPQVTPSALYDIALDHAENAETLIIMGPPGGGKSEIVTQVAEQVNKPVIYPYNLASCDGSEFKGIPNIAESKDRLVWLKEGRWYLDYATTAFIDEYGQGSVPAQNSCSSLLLENRVDDIYLHPDTWRVIAMNRLQDRAGTTRTPNQIPNRGTVVELIYSAEDHIAHEIQRDDTDMLTIRFLRMKGDTAYSYDPGVMINSTPRQWSWVGRKLFRNPDTPFTTIAGRVGKGFATELMAFRDLAPQLPTKEEVLMMPTKARVPDSVSAQFLITDMLADAASVNTFDALVEYAKRMPAEMQAKFVKDSMQRHAEVTSTKAFTQWAVKFAEVLR